MVVRAASGGRERGAARALRVSGAAGPGKGPGARRGAAGVMSPSMRQFVVREL